MKLHKLVHKKIKSRILETKSGVYKLTSPIYEFFFNTFNWICKYLLFIYNKFKLLITITFMSLFLYCIYPVISIFGESIKGELSSNLEVYVVDSFNRNTINLITDFENLNSNYSFAYKNGLDFVEIVPLLFNINFVLKDFRAYVLDEYFRINQSPLYGMGEYIVEICDRYNAPRDCMILPAIAWAETNLCKSPWSASIYNCWGFGGPGENRFRYNSFYESIERVYYSLVFLYGRYYILNPREMQSTFCGRGDECTYWANNVLFAQYQINNLSISLGFPSLYSLR